MPNASSISESFGETLGRVSRLRGTPWENSLTAKSLYVTVNALARTLGRWRVTANTVTYASMVLALAAGVLAGLSLLGWSALIVLLSGALDLLDGAVARLTGTGSKWGALLDSSLDRIADAAPLAGLVVFYSERAWSLSIPLFALISAFVISYVRARAESLGTKLPQLFMRRAERVLLLALSLALGLIPSTLAVPAPLMLAGISVLALLNVVGTITILAAAHRSLLPEITP